MNQTILYIFSLLRALLSIFQSVFQLKTPSIRVVFSWILLFQGTAVWAHTAKPPTTNAALLVIGFITVFALFGISAGIWFWRSQKNQSVQERYLQKARQAEAQAVQANQAKTIFMAHVSHELRTPLNAIIGYSELISEDLEEISQGRRLHKIHQDLDIIKSSAYYQLSLINNLLDLTELETKKTKLFLQDFPIKDLVGRVTHQMQAMLSINKNKLEVFYEPREPGNMRADVLKLEGILVNILTNANKFTSEGMITLRVVVNLEEKQPSVSFIIQDTGIGIKTDHMRTLFQEFSQMVDQTRSSGAGLGLKVCRRFCEMMGGKISVNSTYGEGSTFTIKMPKEVPDSEDSLKSREFPVFKPRRVE